MKKGIFILLIFLNLQVNALTGNDLLKACKTAIDIVDNNGYAKRLVDQSDEMSEGGMCYGYILAINDVFANNKIFPQSIQYCFPSNSTIPQQARVVIRYLQNNPAKLNQTAGELILWASHQAFPCS